QIQRGLAPVAELRLNVVRGQPMVVVHFHLRERALDNLHPHNPITRVLVGKNRAGIYVTVVDVIKRDRASRVFQFVRGDVAASKKGCDVLEFGFAECARTLKLKFAYENLCWSCGLFRRWWRQHLRAQRRGRGDSEPERGDDPM